MKCMTGNILTVRLELPEGTNLILAQSHFIKTAEDVYEALETSAPGIRFGLAFNEASGPRLVRTEGNEQRLVEAAVRNAMSIGSGHLLVILIEGAFPINVMNALKSVQEITTIYCATSNPVSVAVLREGDAAAIIGVFDGSSPLDVEKDRDRRERHDFLRKIGYKK